MAAASYDFNTLDHGDTITGTFTARYPSTNLPVDLSTAVIQYLWYADKTKSSILHTSDSNINHEVVIDGLNGKHSIAAPSAFAAALPSVYYEVKVTINSVLKTYMKGYLPLV